MKKKKARKARKRSRPARVVRHSPLYAQLLDITRLWKAWDVVLDNARRSESVDTKRDADKFRANAARNIERIRGQLRRGTFQVGDSRGVLIPKGDGGKRPLVVAPISGRIVQRAILDVLHETPRIKEILGAGLNFGGVPGAGSGVPGAVLKVKDHAVTHQHYYRTDIRSFFRAVDRASAVAALLEGIRGDDFRTLVTEVVEVEIEDADKHGEDVRLFPLEEKGIAQGSCLSPLLCNVLLHEFDKSMQGQGVVTVRYIDDFIVLGQTAAKAAGAFASAIRKLSAMGLSCYDPRNPAEKDKAEMGLLTRGAVFLGCEISTSGIRPSEKKRLELIEKVKELLNASLKQVSAPKQARKKGATYLQTMNDISNTLLGWSGTFNFCTDERLMRDIDRTISQLLSGFEADLLTEQGKHPWKEDDWRRYRGIWLVQDAMLINSAKPKLTG